MTVKKTMEHYGLPLPLKGHTMVHTLELGRWEEVCERLEKLGAVTKEDIAAPKDSDKTPGQELLTAIRAWGDMRGEIEMQRPNVRDSFKKHIDELKEILANPNLKAAIALHELNKVKKAKP